MSIDWNTQAWLFIEFLPVMAFKSIDLRFYSCILNDIGFLCFCSLFRLQWIRGEIQICWFQTTQSHGLEEEGKEKESSSKVARKENRAGNKR